MDDDTRKTIIMVAIFGVGGASLMALRLFMRQYRGQPFNLSDYLTIAALVCVAARTGFTTVVVLWGNNNLSAAYRASNNFSAQEIYEREIGSKLTLVNRIVYNTYIWIQKAVVLLLYRKMLYGLERPEFIMKFYWVFLVLAYVVAQAVTFVECHPFYLYWQVVPDPGTCPQAPVQLIVFVSLNIVTDVMLIVLPMPWLSRMKRSLRDRLSLIGLFSIGFLLIAIAFVRLPIYGNATSQVNRNTWGSVEEFAAAFVANVPTLFALRRPLPSADTVVGSHSLHHADIGGFRQVNDQGITVTNSVELRHEAVRDVKDPIELQEVWNKSASQDNLVHVRGHYV